jgi:hypothetical protein
MRETERDMRDKRVRKENESERERERTLETKNQEEH